MKNIALVVLVSCFALALYGCAAGSATAGYSMKAGSADELTNKGRQAIVDEAVQRAKDYADNTFVKK